MMLLFFLVKKLELYVLRTLCAALVSIFLCPHPCLFFQVETALEDQFQTGRILASISSRPGQCGRADGYILEGKELEFYLRKIKAKKGR